MYVWTSTTNHPRLFTDAGIPPSSKTYVMEYEEPNEFTEALLDWLETPVQTEDAE